MSSQVQKTKDSQERGCGSKQILSQEEREGVHFNVYNTWPVPRERRGCSVLNFFILNLSLH